MLGKVSFVCCLSKRWVEFKLEEYSRPLQHDDAEKLRSLRKTEGRASAMKTGSICAHYDAPLENCQELGQPFQPRTTHEVATAAL